MVYINSDANGRGFLFAEGSQALEPFMDEIAKQVTDPQTKVTVFERARAHAAISAKNEEAEKKAWNMKELKLEALGSGSDYSAFIQHEGIPSLNLGYGGEDEAGDYHSIYDSYDLYKRFKDPGFQYGVTLAETAGHAVLRMSNADELPFDFTHLFRTISSYSTDLMDVLQEKRESTALENLIISSGGYAVGEDPTKKYVLPSVKPDVPYLDFSPLQNALHQLEINSEKVNAAFKNNISANRVNVTFNQALYRAEQQLLVEAGLPRRNWYKHTIYAPGSYTGYGVKTLPGIREAIEQSDWSEAQQQIAVDAKAIMKLSEYFNALAPGGTQ